jgi:hypothetical protein
MGAPAIAEAITMAAAVARRRRPSVRRVNMRTAPLDEAGRLASEVYHPRVAGGPPWMQVHLDDRAAFVVRDLWREAVVGDMRDGARLGRTARQFEHVLEMLQPDLTSNSR